MLETRIDFKNEAQCSHENRTNSLVRLPEGQRAARLCSLDVFPFGFLITLPDSLLPSLIDRHSQSS